MFKIILQQRCRLRLQPLLPLFGGRLGLHLGGSGLGQPGGSGLARGGVPIRPNLPAAHAPLAPQWPFRARCPLFLLLLLDGPWWRRLLGGRGLRHGCLSRLLGGLLGRRLVRVRGLRRWYWGLGGRCGATPSRHGALGLPRAPGRKHGWDCAQQPPKPKLSPLGYPGPHHLAHSCKQRLLRTWFLCPLSLRPHSLGLCTLFPTLALKHFAL